MVALASSGDGASRTSRILSAMDHAAAQSQAERAARKAGVVVRAFRSDDELGEATALLAEIWGTPASEQPLPAHVMRALEMTGNYVRGAFDGEGAMVGASAGFAAIGVPKEWHSHVTGVRASHHRAGVGYALKLDQRAWAIEFGFDVVTWTFDPLVRRNAVFNLAKLGARATDSIQNAYGPMHDALNAGEESDRLWVKWHVSSKQVDAAAAGRPLIVHHDRDVPVRLDIAPDGSPVVAEVSGSRYLIKTPPDVERMRREEPAMALEWRLAMRQAMSDPSLSGGAVEGVNPEGAFVVSTREGTFQPKLRLLRD